MVVTMVERSGHKKGSMASFSRGGDATNRSRHRTLATVTKARIAKLIGRAFFRVLVTRVKEVTVQSPFMSSLRTLKERWYPGAVAAAVSAAVEVAEAGLAVSRTSLGQWPAPRPQTPLQSEEHTSELQSLRHLVCRLLLEKKKKQN